MPLIPAIILLIAAPAARAANESAYCHPLPQVRGSVTWCWQNSYFDDAAARCLEKLDADVAAERARLSASFRAAAERSAAAQEAKLVNSSGNLGATDASLRGLLMRARAARAELVAYTRAMILPGSPGAGFAEGMGVAEHLSLFSCHQEPREAVGAKIAEIDRRIADLGRADGAALALRAGTDRHDAGLGQLGHGAVSAARAPAATQPAGRAQVRRASTITGEIRREDTIRR